MSKLFDKKVIDLSYLLLKLFKFPIFDKQICLPKIFCISLKISFDDKKLIISFLS